MDSTQTAVAAAIFLGFVLQGIFCWRRAHASSDHRWLAVLTILFAVLGLTTHFLLATGAMVVSPEFGIIMVQGTAGSTALFLLLLCLSSAAAVAAHLGRTLAGLPGCATWSVPAGLFVGALAIWRVEPIGAVELPARLHAYDLWWPVFPLWIGLCVVDTTRAVIRVRRRAVTVLAAAVLAMGFSLWAVYWETRGQHFADPSSAPLWHVALYASAGTILAAIAWLIDARRWLVVSAGLVGMLGAYLWLMEARFPPLLWLWALAVLTLLAAIARGKAGTFKMPDLGKPGRSDDVVAAAALVAVGLCIADALYFRRLSTVVDLALALVAWIAFVEVLSVGPVARVFGRPLSETLSAVKKRGASAAGHLATALGTAAKPLVKIATWFVTFEKLGPSILRALLGIVALVAIAEVRHMGKTVIIPFTELGLSTDEARHFGSMISNRVVNLYSTLSADLEPEVAIMSARDQEDNDRQDEKRPLGLVAPADAADRPEAVVSGELDIGGVTVPVNVITGWIQTPVRWLLGIRVVTGTVQKNETGFLLLANSSDGESFRVEYPNRAGAPDGPAPNRQTESEEWGAPIMDRTVAAERLARELAYKLVATLPDLGRAGMTRWEAAQPYSSGLEQWQRFESDNQDYDALTEAIANFQEALRIDPGFALAHYRLGLALIQDRRPFVATDFLYRSIQANPSFALGYDALASHLYFGQRPDRANLPRSTEPGDEERLRLEQQADAQQARVIWHQLLQFPRRQVPTMALANANAGLCQMLFESTAETRRWSVAFAAPYAAYFHCHRALQLFATLPRTLRDSSGVRTAEAWAWTLTGDILYQTAESPYEPADPDQAWNCSAASIAETAKGRVTKWRLTTSAYAGDALRYYRRASALLPTDAFVRCALATAALAANDTQPMQELAASSFAHSSLAGQLADRNDSWNSGHFLLAEGEYTRAFELDPQDVFARNDFGYKVWERHVRAALAGLARPPQIMVASAERHVRDAARFAATVARRADRSAIHSTLGEILLTQGRAHEAYRELERAMKLAYDHAQFDQIRWELAFAYVCAAAADRRAGRRSIPEEMDLETRASTLLQKIREHNVGREIPSLPGYLPLDRRGVSALCVTGPGDAPADDRDDEMLYELRAGAAQLGYLPCNRFALAAYVTGERPEQLAELRLRVFGLDLDAASGQFSLTAAVPSQPLLLLPKENSHDMYFAQLERIGQNAGAVSRVYPIETRANATCTDNSAILEFGRRVVPPARSASVRSTGVQR